MPPEPSARPLLPAGPSARSCASTSRACSISSSTRPRHGRPLRHGAVGPCRRARGTARQRARRQRSERAGARADGARPVADGSAPGARRDRRTRRACPGSAASRPRPSPTLELAVGDRLSLPHTGQGARSYLAIAGGIESDRFMGSASTDVRGLIGRPLAAGDVLGTAREVVSEMRMSAQGRLAGRRRDGAHPARPAGHARGARAARRRRAADRRAAIARACGSRAPRSPAASP